MTQTAARHANTHPELDEVSRRAIQATNDGTCTNRAEAAPQATNGDTTASAEDELLHALRVAPAEGIDIAELMRVTGMSRPTLYRYLRQFAQTGSVIQVGRGRWRAGTAREVHDE